MKYYSDVQTEKILIELEKNIHTMYGVAYAEMNDTASSYFAKFKERYEQEYKAFEAGKYTEAQFKAWVQTQIARGEGYEKMADKLANRMVEADTLASAYINDKTPSIYSLNHNYEAYRISEAENVDFHLADEQTVKELMQNKNHTEFKTTSVNPKRDYEWNSKKIHSALTSAILQGKSIDKLADSFYSVMKSDRASAIRNARTSFTSAQNAGRMASYEQATEMGIELKKEWICTHDDRTRDSHAEIDGERVAYDEEFSNGLMYPADPKGEPAEVYNCRCTMRAILPNINDKHRETYDEWLERMKPEEEKQDDKVIEKSEKVKEEKPKVINPTIEEKENGYIHVSNISGKIDNTEYKELTIEDFNKMSHSITKEERSIIYGKGHFSGYVNSSEAKYINSDIREGKTLTEDRQKIKDTLEDVISKNIIEENVIAYRYVSEDAFENLTGLTMPKPSLRKTKEQFLKEVQDTIKSVKSGYVDTENNFVSVSLVKENNVMTRKGIEMELHIPKGTNGYVTTNKKESEAILGIGTQLQLESLMYDTTVIPYTYRAVYTVIE